MTEAGPEGLRGVWGIRVGTKQTFDPLLKEIKEVDFLIHDSKHTY